MPAHKGNKYAAKDNPKNSRIGIRLSPKATEKLKLMAKQEKTSITQLIERALLAGFPDEFDGLI